jgi:hypothetical protein
MEYFLICTDTTCRFVVKLREGAQMLESSNLMIDGCPECGHPLSGCCPFCRRPLEVIWRSNLSECLRCGRQLRPDVIADRRVP